MVGTVGSWSVETFRHSVVLATDSNLQTGSGSAPIGTNFNVSDLNTKKLSAARKRFLLFFLGATATKLDEDNGQQESVGESEYLDHMTKESLKAQICNE